MEIDISRHLQPSVELPNWKEGFQLYISDIPGRSIVYFERFQQRPTESVVSLPWFLVRRKYEMLPF